MDWALANFIGLRNREKYGGFWCLPTYAEASADFKKSDSPCSGELSSTHASAS